MAPGWGKPRDDRDARIAELERRLEETERDLEETQRLACVGSWEWLLDPDGEWHSSWSRQLRRIFGRDPDGPAPTLEELVGAIHPEDRADFEALVARVRAVPGSFRHSYRIVDERGEVRHLQARGEVEDAEPGRPRRMYGATQDISELKRSQEQLERAHRLEAVGQLAGGVAHDFNNLLSVILNNAECLREETREKAGSERLREIESAAATAAELTRRLLLFSRRDPSELRAIDLTSAVREAEALLRRTIGEHVELTVEVPADLPPVRLAAGQVEQILVNLAVNARDALPDGGAISVAVERSATVPIVMLRVADDGVGMSEEIVEQAFDPFFTTKPRGQGTGLGLAAVYGIAGRAGGHVEIESEPGRGTEVTVYLPVAEEDADVESPPESRSAPPAAGERAVLVVDNEAAVQRIVSHMLAKHGYRVRTASGAEEAEAVIADSDGGVDLLLTDLLMPEVSGRELAARLRARGVDLPTIFMSGYGEDASPLGPWDEPATVLQKPFKADELLRVVGAALERAETGR
ncbi:MAG TPA: ATP-binding protein [Solirubrobacterales bacterium]|nr:ATP-binding protein [Solirubrobacterales bacterium]